MTYKIKPTQQLACNNCGFFNNNIYVTKHDLTVVKCKNCGLLYINPQFQKNDLSKIYGQNYFQSTDPLLCGYQNYFKEKSNLEKMADYYLDIISKFVKLKNAKIIDVGCAFGIFLDAARKKGANVCGVEISDFASNIARQNKLKIYTGEFLDIKLPNNSFDVVVMWVTLEHVQNPFLYLKKAHQVLKKNGYLFVSVPDADSILAKVMGKKWPGFQKVQEHNYFFTFLTLSKLLQKAGLEIITQKRAPFFCNLGFLGEKCAAYNQILGRIIIKFLKITKLFNISLNFGLMDMLVIAKKNEKN